MKKLATIDLLLWLVCLLIATAVRRYVLSGPATASWLKLMHSLVPGIFLGTTWVALRAIVRELLPAARLRVLRACLTIVVLPCAYFLLLLLIQIGQLPVSRSVIMPPVVLVGILWGIVSELKKGQQPAAQLQSEGAPSN